MNAPSEDLESYLAPGESVVERARGRLIDRSHRSEGRVGVTDRRLLFVADGDGSLDVAHDSICSIRSRLRSTRTPAGIGYPFLAVTGALVTVLGLLATVALQPGVLTLVLALAAVGGAVAAERIRRSGDSLDRRLADAVRRTWRGDADSPRRVLAGIESLRRVPTGGDGPVLAAGVGSLLGLVGLVATTGSLMVVPLTLVALAGFALADVAYRRAARLDENGRNRREERAISVDLVNGRTVALRVDPADRIDRALSEVVREPIRRDGPSGSVPSTAETAGGRR